MNLASVGRALVALSGGVDSSVAAALLVEAGVPTVGVTLHLWDAAPGAQVGRCCAPSDRDDARKTAEALGIPHYVFDERAAFRAAVVDPFVAAYATGTTPAPCVECNRTVKLEWLVDLADELGCTHVVTGHYARIHTIHSRPRLLRGVDRTKDQSYFLFGLSDDALGRLVFPLGDRTKTQTRAEAERLGLPNARKPDSQELCFVPDGDVQGFLRREGAARPGRIVDTEGRTLGAHEGLGGFTVGQRKGLGLGGGGEPRFVLRVVPDDATVVVGREADLYTRDATVERVVARRPLDGPFEAEVQVRSRHEAARATVVPRGGLLEVHFAEPQRSVAPGQAAVVYVQDEVVAGGFLRA